MVLVLGHVVHAVLDGNHAKGMDHVVTRKVAQTIEVVQVAVVGETSSLLSLSVLLDVSLRVGQVACSGGVSTTDRTLLEVALQDVTSGKRIATKNTHVGAVAGVPEKMTLKMLRVKVGLGTMGAWEFPVSVFDRNNRVLGGSAGRGSSRSTGSAGQNAASALRAYNVSRLFTILDHRVNVHGTRSVGRRHAGLRHDSAWRHWT